MGEIMKRFILDGKGGVNPAKFFSCLFLLLLFTGIVFKWFIGFATITTEDLGVIAVPILGLIGNLAWTTNSKIKNAKH